VTRALVVRQDSLGDVLLAGPAVRAVAAGSTHVSVLVAPSGAAAARLLPGVDEVLVHPCPWTGYRPEPVDPAAVQAMVDDVRRVGPDVAVVLTSYHQSPLPVALVLRLAGVPRVVGTSTDYPGSLLDVRHPPDGPHEVQRALGLAAAAGFAAPADDDGRLRVAEVGPRPDVPGRRGCVVVHPFASVPARSLTDEHAAAMVGALLGTGRSVVLAGAGDDRPRAERVVAALGRPRDLVDLVGRTTLAGLAAVVADAVCAVAVNSAPGHLAAAVGTPVVSLFSPVVEARAWAPWGVPVTLLGDQAAPCAASRARECPVAGHPCLSSVDPRDVVAAVEQLAGVAA
jgi:ADP-heptose:LPS heptosyltransferase